MGFIGTLYANILLSIADVSATLFMPPQEYTQARAASIQESRDFTGIYTSDLEPKKGFGWWHTTVFENRDRLLESRVLDCRRPESMVKCNTATRAHLETVSETSNTSWRMWMPNFAQVTMSPSRPVPAVTKSPTPNPQPKEFTFTLPKQQTDCGVRVEADCSLEYVLPGVVGDAFLTKTSITGSIFGVTVGKDERQEQFFLHERLFTSHSEFLNCATKKEWLQQKKVVLLPEDDPATFRLYAVLTYTGFLTTKDLPFEWQSLVDVFVLAEKLQDLWAKNRVIDAMHSFMTDHLRKISTESAANKIEDCISIASLSQLYDGTPTGSQARKLVVDLFADNETALRCFWQYAGAALFPLPWESKGVSETEAGIYRLMTEKQTPATVETLNFSNYRKNNKMAAQKGPRGIEKKRKSKKRKSRTEVSSSESSSESEVEQKQSRKSPSTESESADTTPEPSPKPAKEKNKKAKAQPTSTDGDTSMIDASPSPSPVPVQRPVAPAKTQVPPGKLAEDFDAIYIRKITTELADDLDKVRSAQDFKANSIPMLIHALKQGESLFTTEEKRRVVATAKV
ncbi:hypothetical protein OPT61_g5379 [Boeremia exigua]|uniref:Uncharacterized protein n=1 Tax=Boeremia exigua TaxID=749465 RepID=A0ACC2IAH6_9PLEO|nr:hypothetical protein OPT61_g5379 [Boeremia exigua]